MGQAPQSAAKEASLRMRPGLSPAAMSSAAATSAPTPDAANRAGVGCLAQGEEVGVELADLDAERPIAAWEDAQRRLGGPGDRIGCGVGAQADAGVDERAGAQAAELGIERLGGGHGHVVDLVDRLSAGFERRAPGDAQHPDRLHQAVAGLGHSGGFAAEGGPSRGFGVDGVGLAAAPSRLAVGAVHLHHADALAGEAARQAGTVAAGALHADAHHLAPRTATRRAVSP